MCDCNKDCLGIVVLDECPLCGSQPSIATAIAEEMVEVLLSRAEACNALILAAAVALERDDIDVADVLEETNGIMVSLNEVDETLLVLTEFIEESETAYCDNCLCCVCEYLDECDGTVCMLLLELEDEDSEEDNEETEDTEE